MSLFWLISVDRAFQLCVLLIDLQQALLAKRFSLAIVAWAQFST